MFVMGLEVIAATGSLRKTAKAVTLQGKSAILRGKQLVLQAGAKIVAKCELLAGNVISLNMITCELTGLDI